MLIYPFELSALYIVPIKTVPDLAVLLSTLLLAAVFAACAVIFRRCRPLFFWCALFFVPLIPVSQIVPLVTLINDRYLYFPMLGAAALAAHGVTLLYDRLPPANRWLFYGAVAGCTAILAIGSYQRTAVWRNAITLWGDTVSKNPPSKDLTGLLAAAYKDAGQLGDAIELYRRLFSETGDFVEPRYEQTALRDAAMVFMEIGSFAEAEDLLLRLTTKFPQNPAGFATIATCYSATGRRDKAENAYRQALALSPDNPQVLVGLGTLFLDGNDPDKAAPLLDKAFAAGAEGPDLRVALARLAARRGDNDRALGQLEEALRHGMANPARLRLVPEFVPLTEMPRFRQITGE